MPGNGTNKTTGLVSTYRNGSDAEYSYTYDDNGNITEITQGSTSITYEYDAANRLTRENNQVTNQTVTYEYDVWGNILDKKIYAYTTTDDLTGLTYTLVPYAYTNTAWGDQLTSYNGQAITYDNMGNPTSYRGYTFGWRGKQLTSASNGTNSLTFEYNEDGLRQKKTVDNVDTDYFYNGSVLMGMLRGQSKFLFSYDANGNVVSVDFNGTEYYYLRNAQGDIVKLIDSTGATKVEYTYDTWGKKVSPTGDLADTLGLIQPFRYRGYVYDEETGLYYVTSRYYDPEIGRGINADNRISGVGGSLLGCNMFAYCMNNPVNMSDPTGSWPKWIETAASWLNNTFIQPVKDFFSTLKQNNVVNASSNDANRRPYTGEPGSTYTAPNGDSRTYGPDGTPKHDYDHNDHGRPDKHPHDPNGGHNHDWKYGVRGPAYSIRWEPIAGAVLVTVCAIGIAVAVADDATGIGVADDFLLGPLSAGVREGLILIFG